MFFFLALSAMLVGGLDYQTILFKTRYHNNDFTQIYIIASTHITKTLPLDICFVQFHHKGIFCLQTTAL